MCIIECIATGSKEVNQESGCSSVSEMGTNAELLKGSGFSKNPGTCLKTLDACGNW